MNRTQLPADNAEQPAPPHLADGATPAVRSTRAKITIAIVIVLGLIVAALAIDLATASPRLCASCHELAPRVATWSRSAHSEIACVKCHQPPSSRYALPQRLLDRGRLLGHDVATHIAGGYKDPVDARVSGRAPVPDGICLQCHDPNRKATSGFRILIDHAEHARRNGSCVSCHVRTAHPIQTRGKALSLMAQCFTCHGTTTTPKASAKCGLCHPAGYQLLPASHKAATWAKSHGGIAKADARQCTMCHVEKFCADCHGLAMPHPSGWAKGRTGHAVVAKKGRAICARCHGNRPDMCTVCHHKAYVPSKGTWVAQHPLDAMKRGILVCLDCHSPTDCSRCHVRAQ